MSKWSMEVLSPIIDAFRSKYHSFPSRDDFKGERRKYYERQLGLEIPHASAFERVWGSWRQLREAFGEAPSKFTPLEVAERVSMQYAIQELGMEEMTSETSTFDGFIGDQRVEVKGATLTRASVHNSHYRFRWMIHHREYSKMCDRIVLVGVSLGGEILCVVDIEGRDRLEDLIDHKKSVDLSTNVLFGQSDSKLWPFITRINTRINELNIEEFVL